MATTTITNPTGLNLPEAYALALSNYLTPEQLSKYSSDANKPPLFVYGSLMLPSLLSRIINSPLSPSELALQMTPAILHGYSRHAVRGADFPAVIADPAFPSTSTTTTSTVPFQVIGFLVFGLTASQRKGIDRFESGLYDLTTVKVKIDLAGDEGSSRREGVVVDAEVYVWAGDRDDLAKAEEKCWSFEAFLGSGMGRVWEE